jgi:hypothetical protein
MDTASQITRHSWKAAGKEEHLKAYLESGKTLQCSGTSRHKVTPLSSLGKGLTAAEEGEKWDPAGTL